VRNTRATAALIGTILCAIPTVAAMASGNRSIPDVQQLYRSATLRVRHAEHGLLAKAVLYEADGSAAGRHGVSTAAGITRWRFVFDNSTPGSPYAFATVHYGPPPKAYGQVSVYKTPFLEDFRMNRAPKISLRQAVALLHRARERGRFTSVTLRDPVGPPFDGPRYIFAFVKSGTVRYISVSATTGKITHQD
jgi:hypothetical protein